MLDTDAWECLRGILSPIDHHRRPNADGADDFGALHLILFGELCAHMSFRSYAYPNLP